ncbi:hypothetical protein DVH24_002316 [Malus domestica]|uniref:ADP-ribosylation factor 1 n=1 Tax=Malus domestica TaxID=3750 RepID=A0A498I4X9_MALDO|nr:hypothetical protein DVH24_002316 [Malus domestica]
MFSSLFGNKEARILVLGLDNAGKTTILCAISLPFCVFFLRFCEVDRLQMGEVVSTIPTIGFNVETVQYNNIKFQVWDLGGQTSIRPYWRCYFPNTQAIIYVVDSSDTDRLVIAKDEFHAILEEEELKGAVVVIFANKQDLPGALDDAAITEALELHKIKNRQWAIFKTSAIKGEGLFEGLDWLSNTLKSGDSGIDYTSATKNPASNSRNTVFCHDPFNRRLSIIFLLEIVYKPILSQVGFVAGRPPPSRTSTELFADKVAADGHPDVPRPKHYMEQALMK